ncbi:PTAC2 [Symbiodinium natans]|uniref:PTAC2 protein n=1 Tax=Symbiodinium natans TaxID=878477 RepID=A0A812T1G5_9DINO|nr:PTAC2 [Symbiodinium natans]
MAQGGMIPSAFHCSAAIGACRKRSHWPLAVQMLAFMEQQRSPPNVLCFNLALGCGTTPAAARLLLRTMQQWVLCPDIISFRTALGSCERVADWEEALSLFEEMDMAKVLPDQRCYTALIRALGRQDLWDRALQAFAEMRTGGPTSDQIAYCCTMDVCEKSGHWECSLQLLQTLKEDSLMPDVQSYGSAISACDTGAAWESAVGLLAEMEEAAVVPNAVAASAALSAAETSGAWQVCLALMCSLQQWRLPATALQAASAANALRRVKGQEAAWHLLEAVRDKWRREAGADPSVSDELEGAGWSSPGVLARGAGVAALSKPSGRSSEAILDELSGRLGVRLESVSRLDFPTSGVLPVALGDMASVAFKWIQAQFAARLVEKDYLCLVEGPALGPVGAEGCIELPLRDVAGSMGRSEVVAHGRPARTEFRVLERFAGLQGQGDELMLLRVRLLTGRRHQIRVHFAAIGRHVVGDLTYGRRWQSCLPYCPRLWLHCERIELRDLQGHQFIASAPLPEELEVVLSQLGPIASEAGGADGVEKSENSS